MVLQVYVDVDDSTHCSHIPFMLNLLAHTRAHTRSRSHTKAVKLHYQTNSHRFDSADETESLDLETRERFSNTA